MDGDILRIVNDDGKEVEYDILFTFDSDETLKSYVIYTDHKKNEDGNTLVYTSCYDTYDDNPKLEEVKTKKELDTIQELLNTIDFKE